MDVKHLHRRDVPIQTVQGSKSFSFSEERSVNVFGFGYMREIKPIYTSTS